MGETVAVVLGLLIASLVVLYLVSWTIGRGWSAGVIATQWTMSTALGVIDDLAEQVRAQNDQLRTLSVRVTEIQLGLVQLLRQTYREDEPTFSGPRIEQ